MYKKNYLEDATNVVASLNIFKTNNPEFTMIQLKEFMKSQKMKGLTGLTVPILTQNNICIVNKRKLTWANELPINRFQLEKIIINSLNNIRKNNQAFARRKADKIVEQAEKQAFDKITFWTKIKNFFKKH